MLFITRCRWFAAQAVTRPHLRVISSVWQPQLRAVDRRLSHAFPSSCRQNFCLALLYPMTPASPSSDSPVCVICLEAITEDCLALPCKHHYDYICLLNWLELKPHCPLCKAQLLFIRVFDKKTGKAVLVCNTSNLVNPALLTESTASS